MNQRAIILTVILFICIVAGMFTFATLKKREVTNNAVPTTQVEQPTGEVDYATITRVDAKHFFIDGVHTLVGEILLPTPCDLLETSSAVAESYPEQVSIDFTVINNADTCDRVVTPARFKVELIASEKATFTARFQGRVIELNLIPAEDSESPDDFDLFFKG